MLRKRSLRTVLTLSLLTLFFALPQAPASAATQGPYVIQSSTYQKCVEVPGAGAFTEGLQLVSQNCFGNRVQWQQWYFVDTDSGFYRIVNRKTGRCMQTASSSGFSGIAVVQASCVSNRHNQWRPYYRTTASGVDWYELENRGLSGLCLNSSGGPANNGTKLVASTCGGSFTWTWRA